MTKGCHSLYLANTQPACFLLYTISCLLISYSCHTLARSHPHLHPQLRLNCNFNLALLLKCHCTSISPINLLHLKSGVNLFFFFSSVIQLIDRKRLYGLTDIGYLAINWIINEWKGNNGYWENRWLLLLTSLAACEATWSLSVT